MAPFPKRLQTVLGVIGGTPVLARTVSAPLEPSLVDPQTVDEFNAFRASRVSSAQQGDVWVELQSGTAYVKGASSSWSQASNDVAATALDEPS